MNKIKENLFELGIFAFMCRSFVVGPSVSDALVLISLIISIVYVKHFLNRNKLLVEESVISDIKMLKEELNKIKLDKGIRRLSGETSQNNSIGTQIRF